MSVPPDALDSLIADIRRASFIQPKVKVKLFEKVRRVAMDAYIRGVQKGYEKFLQDFRDGHITMTTPRSVIDEAIAAAQARDLAPSEYFS